MQRHDTAIAARPWIARRHSVRRGAQDLLRNERGVALVIALLVLVTLTVLGLGTFFNSSTDVQISGNQKGASQALYASEAGIADMIDALNSNATYTPPTPYTTSWAPSNITGTVNGFSYTAQVRHRADSTDCDGDGVANEVVKYDKSCFPGSPIPIGSANSYPVEVITATSTMGNYQNTTVVEVTKQKFTVAKTGALTARSNVSLLGNITVDGRTYDANDNLASTPCGNALPSVATVTGRSVSVGGSSTATPAPITNVADNVQPSNPCEALGLPSNCETEVLAPYVRSSADVQNPPMSGNIVWVQGDYGTNCLSGTGLLIVHRPGYDPRRCDPAMPAFYNATDCAANPPANLGNITGNCSFKGLVLADKIDKLAGTGTITGAVISFTDINVATLGAGNFKLHYSCAAIDQFVGGKVGYKLSWERQ